MRYQKLSPRQNLAMTWWNRPGFGDYDGIIVCDEAATDELKVGTYRYFKDIERNNL